MLRVPPNSLEAEQSVLGSMLLSEECTFKAVEKLKSDDFYSASHRRIYTAMEDLAAVGKPVDLVTVVERLEQGEKLSIEEITYLSELTQRVPSTKNITHYIEIITEKSVLRRLIDVCGSVADMAFKGESDSEEILDYASSALYKISDERGERSLVHIKTALLESYKLIRDAKNSDKKILGIGTGFPMMDKQLSGLQPSQLIVIAGRPGMGKTSFAMNIVEHISLSEQKPAAVFSLEMSREQLAMRMLCSEAQINAQNARIGLLEDDDFFKLKDAMSKIAKSAIYIDDTPSIGVTEMSAKVRRLKQSIGEVGVVVIDYLQLMNSGKRVENRQQEISQMTRSLKIMARDLNVPVVLLSQLSRSAEKRENKMPMLSDLRESGAIEQDADVVLFLHREDYYEGESDKSYIRIAKQRNGPVGNIEVAWIGEQTKYKEIDFIHEG